MASIEYDALPSDLVDRVKRQCLDLVGVALAGSQEDAALAVRRLVHPSTASGASTRWGTPAKATESDAALANATAAHALDFDDMWLPGTHPTAPIFSAAFSVAEARRVSGRDLIAAQVAGYEVMGRLHSAVSGRFGWHPTGVIGTVGAAESFDNLADMADMNGVAALLSTV